jgi:hypothetical protein
LIIQLILSISYNIYYFTFYSFLRKINFTKSIFIAAKSILLSQPQIFTAKDSDKASQNTLINNSFLPREGEKKDRDTPHER